MITTKRKLMMLTVAIVVFFYSCSTLSISTNDEVVMKTRDVGIYKAIIEDSLRSSAVRGTTQRTLIRNTNKAILEKGLIIGFYVDVENIDKSLRELIVIIKHPEFFDPYANKLNKQFALRVNVDSSGSQFIGYAIEESFEMVEGQWIFEIWHNDRIRCTEIFDLKKK